MNGPIRRRSLCPQKTPTSNVLFRGVSGNHLTSKGGHTADTRATGRLFFSFAGYTGTTLPPFMFSHVQSMRRRRDDFGTGGSFVLYFCARAVASSYTGLCMLQDLLLFPCAGGADPSLVRDPCQAREQANNPCQELLGSLRDDPKASQPHASTARYASEPQLAGQLRRAVLA